LDLGANLEDFGDLPASETARLLPPLELARSLRHLGLQSMAVQGLSQQMGNLTQLSSLVLNDCPNAEVIRGELQSIMPWLKTLTVTKCYWKQPVC
jgi:hypothetical protein